MRSQDFGVPLVSVLMPTYNASRYLPAAIGSLQRQTYKHWELVIVDDASTDATMETIESIPDARIRYSRHRHNQGIAASRNDALRLANGKYLAWLDADDVAVSTRLSLQVEFLQAHPAVGLVCGNVISIDEIGKRISAPWWKRRRSRVEWDLLWENPIAQSSVMIRRSILSDYPLVYRGEFAPAEDYDLWCRMGPHHVMYRLSKTLLYYRARPDSEFHRDIAKPLNLSAKANARYVQGICGVSPPHFHRSLTAFSILRESDDNDRIRDMLDWIVLLRSRFFRKVPLSLLDRMRICIDAGAVQRQCIRKWKTHPLTVRDCLSFGARGIVSGLLVLVVDRVKALARVGSIRAKTVIRQ